jgi:hypothetical protein
VHAHNLSSFLYKHPNRFHLSTFVFLFSRSVWTLASARTPVDAASHLFAAPRPCRHPCIASILVLALAPTHRTGARSRRHARVFSIDITPTANSHPPAPNPQIKQHTVFLSLPPARYSLSFFMFFLSANKAWKNNKCLNFMLYMIKVANTF